MLEKEKHGSSSYPAHHLTVLTEKLALRLQIDFLGQDTANNQDFNLSEGNQYMLQNWIIAFKNILLAAILSHSKTDFS